MRPDLSAAPWLYSWNPPRPADYRHVRVEDDVREALQNVRVRRPSLQQRTELLLLSSRVGVDVSFIGFPAASAAELEQCDALVDFIERRALPVQPVLMCRALESDLKPILAIQRRHSVQVLVDLYLSSSPIRSYVENWDLGAMLRRIAEVARIVADEGMHFRIAFEDSTRTPPDVLTTCVEAALDTETECVVLNDTAGDCTPAGAAEHARFVAEMIAAQKPSVRLAWHGHNDKGLALANSLAAIDGGADLISGTFTGLGERTGNLALEQLIYLLAAGGNTTYNLEQLTPMCALMTACTEVPIPDRQPIVGADVFSTSTGTHATALLKARARGPDFEDSVYSAVAASSLGRTQTILLGPNSSLPAVRDVLSTMPLGTSYAEAEAEAVLAYCKRHHSTLHSQADIARVLDDLRTTHDLALDSSDRTTA